MTMEQNPAPTPSSASPKHNGMGGIIAIIVIVVLLALGGVYYLMTGGGMMQDYMTGDVENPDPAVQAALSQSSSDEISAIEADVNSTDFAEIDAAMAELDAQ